MKMTSAAQGRYNHDGKVARFIFNVIAIMPNLRMVVRCGQTRHEEPHGGESLNAIIAELLRAPTVQENVDVIGDETCMAKILIAGHKAPVRTMRTTMKITLEKYSGLISSSRLINTV